MGSNVSRAAGCFTSSAHDPHLQYHQHEKVGGFGCDPSDEGLGHSYCYVRPVQGSSLPVSPSQSARHNCLPPLDAAAEVPDGFQKSQSETSFKTISGASVSANTSTPRTITSQEQFSSFANIIYERAAAFESSASFSSLPLQLVPRGLSQCGSISGSQSGPISGSQSGQPSGPLERGFLSGPIERGVMSGPLERGFLSGPLERGCISGPIEASDRSLFSAPLSGPYATHIRKRRRSLVQLARTLGNPVKKVLSRSLSKTSFTLVKTQRLLLAPSKSGKKDPIREGSRYHGHTLDGGYESSGSESRESRNLQWAQGKAGEDRVHVVLSEEHGWLFVGIYDGFNGPDAPDFLLSNLYQEVYRELRGLLWDIKEASKGQAAEQKIDSFWSTPNCMDKMCKEGDTEACVSSFDSKTPYSSQAQEQIVESTRVVLAKKSPLKANQRDDEACCSNQDGKGQDYAKDAILKKHKRLWSGGRILNFKTKKAGTDMIKQRKKHTSQSLDSEPDKQGGLKKVEDTNKQDENKYCSSGSADPSAVLQALARALASTERAFLQMADHSMEEMPELALMGSCVLVMLMKGEDVYVMNVGDSRAILAQSKKSFEGHCSTSKATAASHEVDLDVIGARDSQLRQELERIMEEPQKGFQNFEECHYSSSAGPPETSLLLNALQLSSDHSTSIAEEVHRIKLEHPDDNLSICNDRVKGRLKVTRAFGAGFLKSPRWNDALLERFRVNYVGSAPYVSCTPALHHHTLGSNDRFLVLSSDGLYQYLTNEDVIAHVEWFLEKYPDGDPAQYLIEKLLFRAAKKAGMDFHELLDIPQGDRRSYHDDVSVMVISLEGRIWRSFG